MKFLYLVITIFLLWSCNTKSSGPNIEINNPEVKRVIQLYIDTVFSKLNTSTMTVGFKTFSDTLEIYMFDSPPDITFGTFQGYLFMNQYRVCFVSDSGYEQYFKVKGKIDIPDDVAVANKKVNGFEELVEPKKWSFWSTDPSAIHPRNIRAR